MSPLEKIRHRFDTSLSKLRQAGRSLIDPLKEFELNTLRFTHSTIPSELEGTTIAQLTDLHVGRWIKLRHIEQLVARVNRLDPDLVVLTGDYIGYDESNLFPCIQRLGELDAPTFAVLGNHEHWTNPRLARLALQRNGIIQLANESLRWRGLDLPIRIVGLDDPATDNADLQRAFQRVDRDEFCLTLSHAPGVAPRCAGRGSDLTLSGHTHGYQFGLGPVRKIAESLGVDYYAGDYQFEESLLYISRGLGSSSWPFRIGAHPELALFSLESGSTAGIHPHRSRLIDLREQ